MQLQFTLIAEGCWSLRHVMGAENRWRMGKFHREPLEMIRWQNYQQPEKVLTQFPHTHEEYLRFEKWIQQVSSSNISR